MLGNVHEHLRDGGYELPHSPQTDPVGGASSTNRMIHGGSFSCALDDLRAAWRGSGPADAAWNECGLRVCVGYDPQRPHGRP